MSSLIDIDRWPLRRKLLLVPITAFIGFIFVLILIAYFGSSIGRLADQINEDFFPGFELSGNLQGKVLDLQTTLQAATRENDTDLIETTAEGLKDEILAMFDRASENRAFKPDAEKREAIFGSILGDATNANQAYADDPGSFELRDEARRNNRMVGFISTVWGLPVSSELLTAIDNAFTSTEAETANMLLPDETAANVSVESANEAALVVERARQDFIAYFQIAIPLTYSLMTDELDNPIASPVPVPAGVQLVDMVRALQTTQAEVDALSEVARYGLGAELDALSAEQRNLLFTALATSR
ncbi:MAG: hypothetical protein AAGD38_24065 [Acidobacteriota bacterium]